MRSRATFAGIGAIVVWSLMVGLLRTTTNAFGPELGGALVYSVGAALLFVAHRPTPLRRIPKRYLAVGGFLFIAYEAIFALAIGIASTEMQTIEVSMLNYLWPSFTVLFWAIAHRSESASAHPLARIAPGIAVAAVGTVLTVAGDEIAAGGALFAGLASNPLPYVLAFTAAILWGLYNTVAPATSHGANATAWFFAGIAVTLWVVYLAAGAPAPARPIEPASAVPLVATAAAVACGYALWGRGLAHGDTRTLSIASYFAPVLSSLSSTIILATVPGPVFWAGAGLVAVGSIVSWFGSRDAGGKNDEARGGASSDAPPEGAALRDFASSDASASDAASRGGARGD